MNLQWDQQKYFSQPEAFLFQVSWCYYLEEVQKIPRNYFFQNSEENLLYLETQKELQQGIIFYLVSLFQVSHRLHVQSKKVKKQIFQLKAFCLKRMSEFKYFQGDLVAQEKQQRLVLFFWQFLRYLFSVFNLISFDSKNKGQKVSNKLENDTNQQSEIT